MASGDARFDFEGAERPDAANGKQDQELVFQSGADVDTETPDRMSDDSRKSQGPVLASSNWMEPPQPPCCAVGEARRYVIEQAHWLVCEDGSPFGPALLFLGPGVARRVRAYPANWRQLCDEALHALSLSS